jgi:Pyridoxamine 5'-phosphate oxidase
MSERVPITTVDTRYSGDLAEAIPWPKALVLLEQAELFWVSSVRLDGRPHVTPVVAVWLDGALYFSSGPDEQKSRNLATNPHCAMTTGCNTWDEGVDIVLHGDVEIVRDLSQLQRVADGFRAKYGNDWAFEVVDDGTFRGPALVYQLIPTQALGFGKGPFSHSRHRISLTVCGRSVVPLSSSLRVTQKVGTSAYLTGRLV